MIISLAFFLPFDLVVVVALVLTNSDGSRIVEMRFVLCFAFSTLAFDFHLTFRPLLIKPNTDGEGSECVYLHSDPFSLSRILMERGLNLIYCTYVSTSWVAESYFLG
jgi:hypothetical protein